MPGFLPAILCHQIVATSETALSAGVPAIKAVTVSRHLFDPERAGCSSRDLIRWARHASASCLSCQRQPMFCPIKAQS